MACYRFDCRVCGAVNAIEARILEKGEQRGSHEVARLDSHALIAPLVGGETSNVPRRIWRRGSVVRTHVREVEISRETTHTGTAASRCGGGEPIFRLRDVKQLPLPADALEMPVDQLGLIVLKDMLASRTWNSHNYVIEAQADNGYAGEPKRALAEAVAWLEARGLIARDPDQSSTDAIFVTRTGRKVVENGPDAFYATERLQRNLHPAIEAKARPQFLIGEYEQGVFAAMKAIEIRVRALAKFGDDVIGVDLMNKAFGPRGPLTDSQAQKGEQEGTRALFAGSYAVLRNPAGHREVHYDDVAEAAEAVQTASLLMRLLDRVDDRLGVLPTDVVNAADWWPVAD